MSPTSRYCERMESPCLVLVAVGAVVLGACGSFGSANNGTGSGGGNTASDGGGGSDGSGADGSATGKDGGPVGPDGGQAAYDGGLGEPGPGGNLTQIACGPAVCSIPAQKCCIRRATTPPPYFTASCGTTCQAKETALECTGAANCPSGKVCCVESSSGTATSACRTAPCSQAQLCDPTAAVSGCAKDEPCVATKIADFALPATFGTCDRD